MLALALALLSLTAPPDTALPDTTLPAAARGSWIQTAPVVLTPDAPSEARMTVLYQHLVITDSTLDALSVIETLGTRIGTLERVGYRDVRGDTVTTGPPTDGPLTNLRIRADGDTLIVATLGADGRVFTLQRGTPADVPRLVGDWLGAWVGTTGGQPRAVPLTIRADGTLRFGDARAKGYRVVGPFLLIERSRRPYASDDIEYDVARFVLDGDRLTIDAPDSGPITFSRQ